MCRHEPRARCPAIQGQNDCRFRTRSEGRSGRGVETTRNSMIEPSQRGTPTHAPRHHAMRGWRCPGNQSEAAPAQRLVAGDSNTQKRGRYRSGVLARAFVLAIEQNFQLFLEITGAVVLFRGFKGIHGRSIVFSERCNKFRWRTTKLEGVCVLKEWDVFLWPPGGRKALEYVTLSLAACSHRFRNAGKIAFLPKRFVRIHGKPLFPH